jgi:8-oxo-dGTP diphosphatase
MIVFLTALNLEYQAVRSKLDDVQVRTHPSGTLFEVGTLEGRPAAIALTDKGNQHSAVIAERAITEFSPDALIFVGIAGALHGGIALGDVVVGTNIYAYHGGTSLDDGFKSRPRTWETSHALDQLAKHLDRTGTWRRWLPDDGRAPTVIFGPIAAGEVVLDSKRSEEAQRIREHYNDAVAIEMEAAGVAQAGHLNNSLPVVVIRGISDWADGDKVRTDGQGWQPRAAENAAAFALALAQEVPSTRKPTGGGGGGATNIASGNAHVNVQAGVINGDVRFDGR